MKKTLLFILLLLCIILTGCSNKVTEIKVNDITACIDNFYITDYSFIAVYKDGTEEEVFMTESMFSEEEIRELVSGLTQSATGKDPEITITTWEEWNSNRK